MAVWPPEPEGGEGSCSQVGDHEGCWSLGRGPRMGVRGQSSVAGNPKCRGAVGLPCPTPTYPISLLECWLKTPQPE